MHESHEPIKEEVIAEAKESLEQEKAEEQTAFSVCQKELEQYKNLYFHVTADFQNYKRRIEKEQASLKRLFQQGLLLDVLAILDDVERALESDVQSDVAWRAGLELIAKNIYKILAKYNVVEMQEYKIFNPELHEAVMQTESDTHKSGDIVQVLQKGYVIDGEVLRPAKVSIAA